MRALARALPGPAVAPLVAAVLYCALRCSAGEGNVGLPDGTHHATTGGVESTHHAFSRMQTVVKTNRQGVVNARRLLQDENTDPLHQHIDNTTAHAHHAKANESLWFAAYNGDLDGVLDALQRGGSVHTRRGAFGDTPLLAASSRGNVACVQALLEAGSDASAVDGLHQSPPIYWAAKDGHLATVKVLILAGAPVDQPNDRRATALQGACEGAWEHVVDVLLAAGANASHSDIHGYTPLHFSTVTIGPKSASIIDMLLSSGAQVDAVAEDGATPLMWSATFGNVGAARALVGA
ncbi:unnamed protein product [Ostreobium quekettii]|uniref:Uncharacterized protein n=1 Tax=Ostreobium quekettii TaxID=121088 RepID=A0A8S1IY14_9CHLO|nr:unnamed protein product [Ostreobium quekettii]|eukprot:evm.model.scf_332.3 EVM.evm.TU.scf_332.3   scf_332:37524-42614(-)